MRRTILRLLSSFRSSRAERELAREIRSHLPVECRVFDLAKYLGYDRDMKRVKIGEFRDRASELIRRAAGGETIVILHRDREVAKVVPIRADKGGGRLVGCLARTAEVRGDIETPIGPADAWFRRSK